MFYGEPRWLEEECAYIRGIALNLGASYRKIQSIRKTSPNLSYEIRILRDLVDSLENRNAKIKETNKEETKSQPKGEVIMAEKETTTIQTNTIQTVDVLPIVDKLEATYDKRLKELQEKLVKPLSAESDFKLKQKEIELERKFEKAKDDKLKHYDSFKEAAKQNHKEELATLQCKIDEMEVDKDHLRSRIDRLATENSKLKLELKKGNHQALVDYLEDIENDVYGNWMVFETGNFFNKKTFQLDAKQMTAVVLKFGRETLKLK